MKWRPHECYWAARADTVGQETTTAAAGEFIARIKARPKLSLDN
jgi:hypothetical protein